MLNPVAMLVNPSTSAIVLQVAMESMQLEIQSQALNALVLTQEAFVQMDPGFGKFRS